MPSHVIDRIDDYLAGELSLSGAEIFERHIEHCGSCAQALQDTQDTNGYLQWLVPAEAPPKPGPQFYFNVQKSIEKKLASGWFGNLVAVLQRPRLAYPLLFLVVGLLLTAWTMNKDSDWSETGVSGIPPAQFSASIPSAEDRDLVMISLVETSETE